MGLSDTINKVNEAIRNADEVAKKLTTKDRKRLKSSTFCGPNRSFPVPDCKHVAIAKAYLNRSKFSKSTKQKIAACINRKAKQLGCKTSKPAKAKGFVEYSFESLTPELLTLSEHLIFNSTKELVNDSLVNEDMDLDFNNCNEC